MVEIKDAQFNELLASSNLDEKSMAIVNEKISEVCIQLWGKKG